MRVMSFQWRVEGQTHTHTAKLEGNITIGRSPDCEITIPHKTVSRRHATISAQGEDISLLNLSQTNPIRVNDQQILASGQETTLTPGDTLQLGMVSVQISVTDLGLATTFKVKCTGCGKVSDSSMSDCPWCGTSLAFGETYITFQD